MVEGLDGEGTDMGRITSLSDGVFGFAMTLLVLNLALPAIGTSSHHASLVSYLSGLGGSLLDYALAFIIVGTWWSTHHRIFSAIRRYDRRLTFLNLMFLLLITITPFTLAIVFVYGPSGTLQTSDSARLAVALFSVVEGVTGLVMLAIWRHATYGRRLVDPALPDAWIRHSDDVSVRNTLIFFLAAGLALLLPIVAELVWALTLIGAFRSRRLPARGRRDRRAAGTAS